MGEFEGKVEACFTGVQPQEKELWDHLFMLDKIVHEHDLSRHSASEIMVIESPEGVHKLSFVRPNTLRHERALLLRNDCGGLKEDFRYDPFSLPWAMARSSLSQETVYGRDAVGIIAARLGELITVVGDNDTSVKVKEPRKA